jgi:hypothetical protein
VCTGLQKFCFTVLQNCERKNKNAQDIILTPTALPYSTNMHKKVKQCECAATLQNKNTDLF